MAVKAAHHSGGEPAPSIKQGQQGSALPMCRDAAEVVKGLLKLGVMMRPTTLGTFLSRLLLSCPQFWGASDVSTRCAGQLQRLTVTAARKR